jgi:hypothetical protein
MDKGVYVVWEDGFWFLSVIKKKGQPDTGDSRLQS